MFTPQLSNGMRAALLLSPAYIWLTAAVFLPLSAMFYFSFLSVAPFTGAEWHATLAHYS